MKKDDPLGPPGAEAHDKFVSDVMMVRDCYERQLQDIWQQASDSWNLFLGKWADPRDPVAEKWRAHVTLPYIWSGIQAKLASLSDIFLSADPMIEAEGVGDESYQGAREVERLIDWVFRATQFSKFLVARQQDALVMGTSFFKLVWKEIASKRMVVNSDIKKRDFLRAMQEFESIDPTLSAAAPDFVADPRAFEQWRDMVKRTKGYSIPAPPLDGEQEIVRYRGPVFLPIRMWDVYLDPLIEEIPDQPWVLHRILKPMDWVMERTGTGKQPFDPDAVDYALSDWTGDLLQKYEQDIAIARGMSISELNVPGRDHMVELFEVWQQGEPQPDVPLAVIMNRKAVINRDKQPPYSHGACNIGAIRNTMLSGHFFGESDIRPVKGLVEEANTHRSLRLDSVKLSTIPVFTVLSQANLPDLYSHLRPGNKIPVPRHDILRRLDLGSTPADAYREMSEIKNDIDETNATGQNVRGGAATVGRVSATETQGRVTQALLRVKMTAALMAEDLHPYIQQLVWLCNERMDLDVLKRVSGGSSIAVTPGTLYEALGQDFRFRGPTRALNREMQAQQLDSFVKLYGSWLSADEWRAVMKLHLDAIQIRGADKVITSKGTDQMVKAWEQKMQIGAQAGQVQGQAIDAQSQAQAVGGSATMPPEGGTPPPEGGA